MSSAGNYSVTVSNSAGGVASSNATLSVYPTAAATLSISAATNGRAVVSLSGVPGFNYALQSSTDLVNWICLQTNDSPCTLMVTNDSPAGYQFFRALCLP